MYSISGGIYAEDRKVIEDDIRRWGGKLYG